MAGEQHGLAVAAAPRLCEGSRTDASDLSIDDGTELVDHHPARGIADYSRQVGAKPLAGG